MNYNKEAKSLTFGRGSEVSQGLFFCIGLSNSWSYYKRGEERPTIISVWAIQSFLAISEISITLGPKPYLNPKQPTFLRTHDDLYKEKHWTMKAVGFWRFR